MPRIYDSSHLTKRKQERAIAGSFLTRMYPPNPNVQPQTGAGPLLGIYDNSIMNSVKTGHMTEITRYDTCFGISPGCPCPELNSSVSNPPFIPAIPGNVTGITFTVGSIIVSWEPPSVGTAPFTYQVTPYLNGVAQTAVQTTQTNYRFTNVEEWQPYTFTVCAINAAGQGPDVPSSTYFIAPPAGLSEIMSGSVTPINPDPALKYVINAGLDTMLEYIASVGLGPTRGSRYIYVWIASVVGAWNWVRPEARIEGVHDEWNWSTKIETPLSDNDSIIWICSVIDYIMPYFIPTGYKSIYNCPANTVQRVKAVGEWDSWVEAWQSWYTYRENDGYKTFSTVQPTTSANWDRTIVIDGTTINNIWGFPKPREWTRLTVQDKKQGYLTYYWNNVKSTCLTDASEQVIEDDPEVQPAQGEDRDAEIDEIKEMYTIDELDPDNEEKLNDEKKIVAEFWAGGPGTVSPPLMFIWLWKEYIKTIDISCPNIMFSLLDLGIHLFEGGRVTWRLKAAHMEARPIQEIRRRYGSSVFNSWNGNITGAQWIPYQEANFVTPPFADFPSGHSHFSKAFALTMNEWFGPEIVKNQIRYDNQKLICPLFQENQSVEFGDFIVAKGASLIQPSIVPADVMTLSFDEWDDMADQAGISRLYGGIHAISAHTGSQRAAELVDELIQSTWNIQKSDMALVQSFKKTPPMPATRQPISVPLAITPLQTIRTTNPYKIKINYVRIIPSQDVQNMINSAKVFIESIITESHGLRLPRVSLDHDMIVDLDIQPLGAGILGGARPTIANASVTPAKPVRQSVILNSKELNASSLLSTVTLNNTKVAKLVPVLIHEMLHGLGVASLQTGFITVGWDQFLDSSKLWYAGPKNDWTKSEAIKAYREVVGTHVTRIPIENSFGQGTAYSHWEEGIREGLVKERRVFNYGAGNVFHPALPEEIMTGVAGKQFYFTKLTAGALIDHGYKVDLKNPNIVPYPRNLIQT